VRSFEGGKLRSLNDNGREHLPLTEAEDACLFMEAGNSCYFAGDARVNQIVSVTALHVVFLREHNSIASRLAHLNPHWDDETLFQETRHIVTAVFQHITYNEYLPVIVGESLAEKFKLLPLREGWANVYDPYVNPSITNEFSGAAFRFGHSSVDGRFL
jgi:peroxidase